MKKLLYIGMILLFAVACNSAPETVQKSTKENNTEARIVLNGDQVRTGGIEVAAPVFEAIGATIRVNGKVEVPPQNKTAITFAFGGFVKQIKVLDGMQVKQGQVLITLEDPAIIQLQQEYLESSSQLEYLKGDYERQRQLNDQQVNSQKTMQMAKSNYFTMLAKTKGLKAKLELAGLSITKVDQGNIQREVSIRAPFNGIVTKMNAEVGTYAHPQDILMELIDMKHNHIEAFVFEKDITKIKIGQKVHIKTSTQEQEVLASVFLIGKEIGMDKTVKVHLHLDKENQELIPGSYVQAFIDLSALNSWVIPEDGVVQYQGKDVVFEFVGKEKNRAIYKMIEVERLGEEQNKIAIRSVDGKVPKQVVTSGAYAILSALLIQEDAEE